MIALLVAAMMALSLSLSPIPSDDPVTARDDQGTMVAARPGECPGDIGVWHLYKNGDAYRYCSEAMPAPQA